MTLTSRERELLLAAVDEARDYWLNVAHGDGQYSHKERLMYRRMAHRLATLRRKKIAGETR